MDFATEQRSPNYLYGIEVGILVAFVAAPIHRLIVIMTYSNGYYSDWPVLLLLIGVVISLAMSTASRGEPNIGMAILAGLFTLFSFLLSEYLVMHFFSTVHLEGRKSDKG